jgi:hypothetical protein
VLGFSQDENAMADGGTTDPLLLDCRTDGQQGSQTMPMSFGWICGQEE